MRRAERRGLGGVRAHRLGAGLVPTGSSTYPGIGSYASLTDGDDSTLWHAGDGDISTGSFLHLDLGMARTIASLRIVTHDYA